MSRKKRVMENLHFGWTIPQETAKNRLILLRSVEKDESG
jgi:hypothetical protein